MTIIDLIVLVLSVDAIVTVWFYGSIFEKLREFLETRGGKLGELAGCPLCFSYHVGFWVTVYLVSLAYIPKVPAELNTLLKIPLYALAATDLVHFLQGIRPFEETPRTLVEGSPQDQSVEEQIKALTGDELNEEISN